MFDSPERFPSHCPLEPSKLRFFLRMIQGLLSPVSNKHIHTFFFIQRNHSRLTMRLLLLSAEQSKERRLRDAHNLETDSRNISDGVTRTTESSNQHLVVLIHKVQATIARNEGSDLLSVLDQLHTHALTNGRVGLLGLHSTSTSNPHQTTYTFSRTIPLAIVAPPRTLALIEEMLCPFL